MRPVLDMLALQRTTQTVDGPTKLLADIKALLAGYTITPVGQPPPPPPPTPTPPPPPPPPPVPTFKVWHAPAPLNQGNTGHCVGFAGAHWMMCEDLKQPFLGGLPAGIDGHEIYYDCKVIDGAPQGSPHAEEGSNDRSFLKVMQNEGFLASYVYANSLKDVTDWILNVGPVLVGVPWYESMFNPDANGMLNISGQIAGGHEFLVHGLLPSGNFQMLNSWGQNWGIGGHAYLRPADLWRLVTEQGDACGAIRSR